MFHCQPPAIPQCSHSMVYRATMIAKSFLEGNGPYRCVDPGTLGLLEQITTNVRNAVVAQARGGITAVWDVAVDLCPLIAYLQYTPLLLLAWYGCPFIAKLPFMAKLFPKEENELQREHELALMKVKVNADHQRSNQLQEHELNLARIQLESDNAKKKEQAAQAEANREAQAVQAEANRKAQAKRLRADQVARAKRQRDDQEARAKENAARDARVAKRQRLGLEARAAEAAANRKAQAERLRANNAARAIENAARNERAAKRRCRRDRESSSHDSDVGSLSG